MSHWLKRYEHFFGSKALKSLRYSWLLEWLLVFWLKCCFPVVAEQGVPLPEDEKDKWIRNKLKALARLLGRLGAKAAKALAGIIGEILSWILSRASDVVVWVLQNLWALVVGIEGLLYMFSHCIVQFSEFGFAVPFQPEY